MKGFTAIALFALIAAANSHGHCGRGGIGGGYSSLGGGSQYASANQGYQAQQAQQYSASTESNYAASDASVVDAGYGSVGYGGVGGVVGGGAYGSAASNNYAAQSQKQASYSKSVKYSASSASASSQYAGLTQYYPQLGGETFFQNIYNLVSTEKSQTCGKYFTSDFDYETSFNSWFSKNQYFSQFLGGATGFDFSQVSQRSQFYSLLKTKSSHSGSLVRAIRSFARHGSLYNSDFGRLLVTHSSTQLLQSYSQYQQYGAVQSWDQWGLSHLFKSKYYQSRISSFLGLQSFEYSRVSSALSNAFRTNFGGTLLGLRHLLLRRDTKQSFSWSNYQSISSSSVYEQYRSRFGYRLPYSSYLGGASSSAYGATNAYSSDISSSSYSSVSESDASIVDSSIGGVGYSGIGGAGYGVGGIAAASSAYGSQQQVSSSQYSRSSSVVSQQSQYSALQQYYPVLGQDSFFQNVYGLVSVERSAQCGKIITQDFNFESTFNTLFSNQIFSNYFWQSIGIQTLSSVQDRTRLFGLIKSNPGFFVRSLRTFARHGAVYNSNFGKFLLENSSTYLFQNYQTVQRQYYSRESWSQWGLDSLLQSKYYQRKLATFFGLGSSYSYEVVSTRLQGFLQKNFASGLLALRHLVLRRDVGQYFNFRSYSRISSFKSYESWRSRSYRCPYYSAWNQASAASSYQSAQSQSSYSRSSAQSAASSKQYAGAASGYGSQGYSSYGAY